MDWVIAWPADHRSCVARTGPALGWLEYKKEGVWVFTLKKSIRLVVDHLPSFSINFGLRPARLG